MTQIHKLISQGEKIYLTWHKSDIQVSTGNHGNVSIPAACNIHQGSSKIQYGREGRENPDQLESGAYREIRKTYKPRVQAPDS